MLSISAQKIAASVYPWVTATYLCFRSADILSRWIISRKSENIFQLCHSVPTNKVGLLFNPMKWKVKYYTIQLWLYVSDWLNYSNSRPHVKCLTWRFLDFRLYYAIYLQYVTKILVPISWVLHNAQTSSSYNKCMNMHDWKVTKQDCYQAFAF